MGLILLRQLGPANWHQLAQRSCCRLRLQRWKVDADEYNHFDWCFARRRLWYPLPTLATALFATMYRGTTVLSTRTMDAAIVQASRGTAQLQTIRTMRITGSNRFLALHQLHTTTTVMR